MDSNQPRTISDATEAPEKRAHLSARRLQVLALVAEGASDGEIALALRISPETVAWHMKEIRTRLNARSRAHAVALAIRQGLLPGGGSPDLPS